MKLYGYPFKVFDADGYQWWSIRLWPLKRWLNITLYKSNSDIAEEEYKIKELALLMTKQSKMREYR